MGIVLNYRPRTFPSRKACDRSKVAETIATENLIFWFSWQRTLISAMWWL